MTGKILERQLDNEAIKHIVKERNKVLGQIYRKQDTDQGRAHKSPLLKLRKRYAISIDQLSKATGIHKNILRKIEADEPRMAISSRTLIKLADFFVVKYCNAAIKDLNQYTQHPDTSVST